ncbi:assimilatory sulfite reductase (NADPH) flavoprotein subunit [Celerinatantimonas diazotrophica]|uniref:Sulfite reductase [NADPH] flavoprotein alpha-component n=1 Tax=Celerinatantimonas diazotrophica TaxID=412034 RepID=A0A4R1J8K9_9GAMM|nr:assimilatory sulfite reductase (NADPH) flavoprotein subunit [Celerinatantimonas diazotrophica]TCK46886.1 sulfite reductase (NADPH) alpha subunit [Celerinatantimonas diazotrophica]CAG9295653.1 Sulfite reductase [NADPH] flavoprotein alpha-component [Celerinatantimonas diazotrophica]
MSLQDLNALSCPLSSEQLKALEQVLGDLSPLQQAWVSGYLYAKNASEQTAPTVTAASGTYVTILYASQTGNAKAVAEQLFDKAQQHNVPVQLQNIVDYKSKSLKKERFLVIVASTNGEGEPPDDAMEFHDFLVSKKAPKIPNLHYAVLSLGDSSYEHFCKCGVDFDERLQALGAQPLLPRVDCDLDYEQPASQWQQSLLEILKAQSSELSAANSDELSNPRVETKYDRAHPATATVLTNQKITGRHSLKDIRHIEFDLDGVGMTYQSGDALGVWFENDMALVEDLLGVLSLDAEQSVIIDEQSVTLRTALTQFYELTQTPPGFVEFWADRSGADELQQLKAQKPLLREYAATHQIIDVVSEYPASVSADELLGALRRLTPRMYSIASSQAEVEDEVHLCVAVVSFKQGEAERFGGCSGFLSRLREGQSVKIFVEANHNFKLPRDHSTPVIMIGPGTGIAPFRAFLQQRDAEGSSGDNWLFFGNPHFTEDFLYQSEIQGYVKSGLLSRIDLAFSRDQANKVYVQDRLRERSKEVYDWLANRGAHLYICGDSTRMAKDVEQTLLSIASEQGQMSQKEAEDWLKSLRCDKRYQKDVY